MTLGGRSKNGSQKYGMWRCYFYNTSVFCIFTDFDVLSSKSGKELLSSEENKRVENGSGLLDSITSCCILQYCTVYGNVMYHTVMIFVIQYAIWYYHTKYGTVQYWEVWLMQHDSTHISSYCSMGPLLLSCFCFVRGSIIHWGMIYENLMMRSIIKECTMTSDTVQSIMYCIIGVFKYSTVLSAVYTGHEDALLHCCTVLYHIYWSW